MTFRRGAREQIRRLFSLILAITILISVMPLGALAQTAGSTLTETDDSQARAQVDVMLDALTPYLYKTQLTQEELLDLQAGLEQLALFCGEHGIGLSEDQLNLYNLLYNALISTPEVAYAAQVTASINGEEQTMMFATLQEAVDSVSSAGATLENIRVTLLRDVVGDPVTIDTSLELDMAGHTYHLSENAASGGGPTRGFGIPSQFVFNIGPGNTVTVKNGTVLSSQDSALIINGANLTLHNMNLTCSSSADQWALYCAAGTTQVTGGTILSASGNSTALSLLDIDYGPVTVELADTVTVAGQIEMNANDQNVNARQISANRGLNLRLNNASVTGSLVFGGSGGYVTKLDQSTNINLQIPAGFRWNPIAGTSYAELEEVRIVAEIWRAADNGTLTKQSEHLTLADAVANAEGGDTVKLLVSATGGTLFITDHLTLDLNGCTYTAENSGSGSAAVQIDSSLNVTIKNGVLKAPNLLYLAVNYGHLILSGVELDGSDMMYAIANLGTVEVDPESIGTDQEHRISGKILLRPGAEVIFWKEAQPSSCTLLADTDDPIDNPVYALKHKDHTVTAPAGYDWVPYLEEYPDADPDLLAYIPDIADYEVLKFSGRVACIIRGSETMYEDRYGSPYTLESAVHDAQVGDTVKLLVSASGNYLDVDQPITLDLGGNTYTVDTMVLPADAAYRGAAIRAYNNGGDPAIIQNGTIVSTVARELIANSGDLILKNVKLQCAQGQTALAADGGTVILSKGTDLSAASGTALEIWDATVISADLDENNNLPGSPSLSDPIGASISGRILISGWLPALILANASLDSCSMSIDPSVTDVYILKAERNQLAAPIGYQWDPGLDENDEKIPGYQQLAPVQGVAHILRDGAVLKDDQGNEILFDFVADAIDYADAGDTVQLRADTAEEGLKISKSIILDLNQHTFVGLDDGSGYSSAVQIFSRSTSYNYSCSNVTIQNGTITAGDQNIFTLVNNSANLVLSGVHLKGTEFLSDVLYCETGSVRTKNKTVISAASEDQLALVLDNSSGSANQASSISLADDTTVTGQMLLFVSEGLESGGMVLQLNKASVTGPLVVEGSREYDKFITVTKAWSEDEDNWPLAPAGFFWKDNTTLVKTVVPYQDAIVIGDYTGKDEDGDGFEDGIYFDDLQKAVDSCTKLKMVNYTADYNPLGFDPEDLSMDDSYRMDDLLTIRQSVELDLNGVTLNAKRISFTGGYSTIFNGTILGTRQNSALLLLEGGNVTVRDLTIGNGSEEFGVVVQGSAFGTSSFTMEDSQILAYSLGIVIEPCQVAGSVNSVTVNPGSKIAAQCGIFTGGLAEGYPLSIRINGGSIEGTDCGIAMSGGDLSAIGGTISGGQCGIDFYVYDGPLTARINGATVTGGVYIASDPENGCTADVSILSRTVDAVITDDNIGTVDSDGTTKLYKPRGMALPASAESGKDTIWYDPGTGDMVRFVFGSKELEEKTLNVIINWVDDNDALKMRPQEQSFELIPKENPKLRTADTSEETGFTSSMDAHDQDGDDNKWTQGLELPDSDGLAILQANGFDLSTVAPKGYDAKMDLKDDGTIEITFTLLPPKTEVVTETYTYYTKKVRTKHVYYYDQYGNLLQTGQLTWPVPVMSAAGLCLMGCGVYLLRKRKGRYER